MRKRGRWTYAGVAAIGVVALSVLAPACSTPPDPPAGLELIVGTNLGAPGEYDAIRVQVSQQTGANSWNQLFDYAFMMPGGATLPATLAIAPGPTADQDALIKVTAYQGYESDSNPGKVRVLREAQVQIPTTRVAQLELDLLEVCVNVVCTNPDTSCQPDGMCGSNVVQTSSLSTYTGPPTSTLEAGAACQGKACDAASSDAPVGADSGKDATTKHDATGPGGDAARDTGGSHDDAARDADQSGDTGDRSDGDDVGDADGVHDAHDKDAHEGGHSDAGVHEDSGNQVHDAGRDATHDGTTSPKDSGLHPNETGAGV